MLYLFGSKFVGVLYLFHWMTNQAQAAGVDVASPKGDQLPSGAGSTDRVSHNELVNPSIVWGLRQYGTQRSNYDAPRTTFYTQNPPSPYDTSTPDNSNGVDFHDTSDINQHMHLLNNRSPRGGEPFIYNEGGDGRFYPDAMQNFLDSIKKNYEEENE